MNTISNEQRANRAVSNWIFLGVIMLLVQVVLGGVTRLTGSGLSITEWDVVTGFLPPLNEHQWLEKFAKYQQSPQYRLLNSDFTLADFKFIFFWEWFHRLWARLIAVAFVVGFMYLLAKKYIKKEMVKPLLILFAFGALQGAIGWIMVASGLTGDAIYVRPTKLAMHFIFALALISYAFWQGLQLKVPAAKRTNLPGIHKWSWALVIILFAQLIFGALMAGHKAATAAPTWPTINGSWVPDGLLREEPVTLNFFENKVTIHFVHRGLAYALLILIIIYSVKVFRIPSTSEIFTKARRLPLILVTLQVLLGILSVLTSTGIIPNHWGTFEWLAQLHQITGMLLLLSLVAMVFLTRQSFFKQPS
ncbi:cytochrome C oxidase assembly protein [Niastella koreensis]|uniref:Heme A synthase n=2 Tax=Niastella koreensis TaxID=354356 RepID=G8TGB2_NIAKG|nr:COX15/CtaA family protein [Niastella koreensis]AEW02751.1 Heme A synthase [Niastella koreensis GR20-10]OQP55092.1 cytochrome C oxidase assembly protein [Niastella koreensis]